jgi:hypothetical protein
MMLGTILIDFYIFYRLLTGFIILQWLFIHSNSNKLCLFTLSAWSEL